MRSLVFHILACQIYFSSTFELYSTLSCILLRSNDLVLADHNRSNDLSNVTDGNSLESKIKFRVYTQNHPEGKQIIFKDEESLKESGFDVNSPTRFVTHGFLGKGEDEACMGPTEAFLSKESFNIIVLDWSAYQSINYFYVVNKVKPTALHLSEMINFLEEHGMNTSTTALIGHSLGAHVVGIAGYNSKSQINHIVGIDPAEPSFRNKSPGERISREDATHVEIIHTNGGHCGMKEAVGHYDFYANGGSKQPGCNKNLCSHGRSHEYYTESIMDVIGFYARRCTDSENIEKDKCTGELAIMGGLSHSFAKPGVYYVETNSESPFAKRFSTISNFIN